MSQLAARPSRTPERCNAWGDQAPGIALSFVPLRLRPEQVMMESAAGEAIAAPRPWTARAVISQVSFWANPAASEARAKRAMPDIDMTLRLNAPVWRMSGVTSDTTGAAQSRLVHRERGTATVCPTLRSTSTPMSPPTG
jgi:hypothetical protein